MCCLFCDYRFTVLYYDGQTLYHAPTVQIFIFFFACATSHPEWCSTSCRPLHLPVCRFWLGGLGMSTSAVSTITLLVMSCSPS